MTDEEMRALRRIGMEYAHASCDGEHATTTTGAVLATLERRP